jgi:hypothetical protein
MDAQTSENKYSVEECTVEEALEKLKVRLVSLGNEVRLASHLPNALPLLHIMNARADLIELHITIIDIYREMKNEWRSKIDH